MRVLLIEDDEDDYQIMRDLLRQITPGGFELCWAASYDAGLRAMDEWPHDICLLDYRLGHRSGLDLLRQVRNAVPEDVSGLMLDTVKPGRRKADGPANGEGEQALSVRGSAPFILLTGWGDKTLDMEAMKAGAADYLVKGHFDADSLERAMRYALERARVQEALCRARDELELRVRERTIELARTNDSLQTAKEEAERARAEAETAREEAETAREEAERANQVKTEFLAHMSHEFRTPLTTILGFAQLLESEAMPPDQAESVGYIIEAGQHLLALVNQLLDIARLGPDHQSPHGK